MKRKLWIIIGVLSVLLVTLLVLLFVLGSPSDTSETTAPETSVPETTVPETTGEPATEPPTDAPEDPTDPTDPVIRYENPLTGEENGVPATDRPFAVVINNIRQAIPQHGVSQADMIFECLAEGGVTRCMALFSDLSDVEKLGSIRSARTYFIDLAQAFDSILVHVGGSSYAYSDFNTTGWPHLDALVGGSSAYFYRDQDRKNAGYAYEHTLFTDGPRILAYAEKKGLVTSSDTPYDFGLTFAKDGTPAGGEPAQEISVRFRSGGKLTKLVYNEALGKYESYEYGDAYVDGNTGDTMAFTNIIVIRCSSTTDSSGYRVFHTLTGTGNGYFACGGKIVPIKWSRSGDTANFVFTLEDGTPVTLGRGTSYVAIVPIGSPLEYT